MAKPRALDRELKRLQDAAAKLAREQFEKDVRAVLNTPEGRRFAWWCLRASGLFGGVSEGAVANPGLLACATGRRSFGVDLQAQLQRVAPESYVAMVEEQLRAAREAAKLQQAHEAAATARDEDQNNGD